MPTLCVVGTPIGNLGDMTPRAIDTLRRVALIAAEDTRVTLKLLNHLGLKKPMMSYYEHALHHGAAILDRIEAGESCALCSDAGMPCISDPGEQIVREAEDQRNRTLAQLEKERSGLEHKIDELRRFESDYRTRLKSYLQGLLSNVEDGEEATAAGL